MLKYFADYENTMTNENEKINDMNSPVQTQESEMGHAKLQVGTS